MLLLCIICYDIWFYLSHIVLHKKYMYKMIYRVHHSIDYNTMEYNDTYVGHIIEGPLQGMGVLFPFLVVEFNVYVLVYSLIAINIRGMLRHDTRFVWLIGNHHVLHHKYPQYNYGEYWLDKLFRTNYPNESEYIYGLVYI